MRFLILMFLVSACNKGSSNYNDILREDWQTSEVDGKKVVYNEGDLRLVETPNAPSYPVLIGGAPADRKDWPASFTTTQGNSSRCTGTVIGPRALQLAAHCVGNGKSASIKSGADTYTGKCTHHQNYKSDPTADYALCFLDKDINLPWFENVMITRDIKVGDKILLAGMGCVQPGGGGGNDDVFRIGETTVVRIPESDNDIVTKGNAALCFGDSGGSAYFKGSDGVYRIAGVNSRGDIQTTSYLSAVYTDTANKFYAKWVVDNNAPVCGITQGMANCRGGGGEPNPTPVPPWCAATLEKVNRCIYGNPRLSLSEPQKCRDEYSKLFACQVASENDQ